MRLFKVFLNKFKVLSFSEFIFYFLKTLYQNELFLVYTYVLNSKNFKNSNIEGVSIEKGKLSELDDVIANKSRCPWEYTCHLHDGVENFFVAKNNSGIQHISWIYAKNDHNQLLKFENSDIEIKHCYTDPSIRGRGVYPSVIETIKAYARSCGKKRIFMTVHHQNKASIRGIEKSKFVLTGQVRFIKFFGIRCSKRLTITEI